MANNVRVLEMHQISIPKHSTKSFLIPEKPLDGQIRVTLKGPLLPRYYQNLASHWMTIWVQMTVLQNPETPNFNMSLAQNISEILTVPVVSGDLTDSVPGVEYQKTFKLQMALLERTPFSLLELKFATNTKINFPVSVTYNVQPINTENGIIYAALILVALYILIIFDVVHRTVATMLASTMSIALLAVLNARPTMSEIISWIDVDTLTLLFSMMVIVTIFGDTGIFDSASVCAYKVTKGKPWSLIVSLCFISALFSCLLDNVTTTLLMTPVTIRLCEIVKLDTVKLLTFIVIFANLGGGMTPIGDPPNVLVASNKIIKKAGVNFGVFTVHMCLGGLICFIIVYIYMKCMYCHDNHFQGQDLSVDDLKREIAVWRRAAASLSSYSKDEETVKESIIKKTASLRSQLDVKLTDRSSVVICSPVQMDFVTNLKYLQNQYPIRDKVLLIKCTLTLLLVVCLFFLHSIPAVSVLGLGWTALLGALLLLLLHNEEIESVLGRIEWSTLIFFASLFVLMEALARLGLIDWVGAQTQNLIMSVKQESRLTVAIILLLWVSGFASAFVDNLPLTTMMIRVATSLADDADLHLPLQPLVWALSFGACLGANGTLFASSSNIVCAGVAEQHGYRFSFLEFSKTGLPVMLSTMISVTLYLIVCHVVFSWH